MCVEAVWRVVHFWTGYLQKAYGGAFLM